MDGQAAPAGIVDNSAPTIEAPVEQPAAADGEQL